MELIKEFNEKLLVLVEGIARATNKKFIINNIGFLKKIINIDKKRPIDFFIIYILPHKEEIDTGNENFFLTYELKSTDLSSKIMKNIFEFKNIWSTLTNENKETVVNYMKYLCSISQTYFLQNY
jgi:hypothetical protein